jgi:hypothetical protein
MKKLLGMAVASMFGLMSMQGTAEELGAYVGAKYGYYRITKFDRQDSGGSYGLYTGYRFHRHVGAELEYVHQMETDDPVTYEGNVIVASLRPALPLGRNWELYAKLGWAWVDGDFSTTGDSPPGSRSQSRQHDGAIIGYGMGWKMWRFHGRVEYLFDDIGQALGTYNGPDFGFLTLGFGLDF